MNKPFYITTLQSAIENQEQERQKLQKMTEEFLSQGGSVTEVPPGFSGETPKTVTTEHNKRVAAASKRYRDRLADSVAKGVAQGKNLTQMAKELNTYPQQIQRIILENGIEVPS